MIVPDANLLLYAYDGSSPFHAAARDWWDDLLSGSETVGLTHPTLFGFLRIATSQRVFAQPMSLEEATTHIAAWLGRSVVDVLSPGASHARDVLALLKTAGGAAGNLTTDAQIASLALHYKGTIHTADRDFLRFKTVPCIFPLDD